MSGSILRTAGLGVCLAGCAEGSWQVVRSNQAPTPIAHLFVTVAQGPFDQSYAEQMSDALDGALRACRRAGEDRFQLVVDGVLGAG